MEYQGIFIFEEFYTELRKKKVLGMMSKEELYALYIFSLLNHAPGHVVEIGSWAGLSTIALAKGTQSCHLAKKVIAIDHFQGNIEHQPILRGRTTYEMFKRNTEVMGVSKQIEVLHMYSEQAIDYFQGDISLLLIDSEHTYDNVTRDLALYTPRVTKEGYVLLHDYTTISPTTKAIDDWLASQRSFRVVCIIKDLLVVQRIE